MPEDAPQSMALGFAMLKSVLRRQLRARLRGFSEQERQRQSSAACLHLRRVLKRQLEEADLAAQTLGPVALFVSMAWEIDTEPLDQWLREQGIARAFPVIGEHDLIFRLAPDLPATQMPLGPLNIPAPSADQPLVALEDCRLVICPGLAFDRQGRRLGQGRGYYDRALRSAKRRGPVKSVGYFMDNQAVEAVPTDEHDETLSALCSPASGYLSLQN